MPYVFREIHTRQCCCTVCATLGCNCHTALLGMHTVHNYNMNVLFRIFISAH